MKLILTISIEFYLLDLKLSCVEPNMTALMRLVAIKPAAGLPIAVLEFTFVNRKQTNDLRTGMLGLESDRQRCACDQKFVWACRYDQTTA